MAIVVVVATSLALNIGCVKKLAVNALASAMAEGGDVYASDDDPELVRDAMPFALKTMETLIAEQPEHAGLLVTTSRGFTQYAYAFVERDAEKIEPDDYHRSVRLRERALGLYLRARDYGLRALELERPGITERLKRDPEAAAAEFDRTEQVDAVFWTAAAWGAAISTGMQRPELVADIDAVRALVRRALALDEDYERGAIHLLMITLESLPEAMGGSPERAREHFERAVELSEGTQAAPYVTYAVGVTVPAQDREAFVDLLETALEIDPDVSPPDRLANIISRSRARMLLDRIDELFL
jgi:predicted anti-sigma-YlaC factor YlaD